jgi:hypothetical protein
MIGTERRTPSRDFAARQLKHLAEMSRRPNITIQVVPFTASPHSGLLGAFVVAELDDSPPVVYLETAAEGETRGELSCGVALPLVQASSITGRDVPK